MTTDPWTMSLEDYHSAYGEAVEHRGLMAVSESMTLRDLRLAKGLSQCELADILGTSQQYVSKLERGFGVGPRSIRSLAAALDQGTEAIYAAWTNTRRSAWQSV